MPEKEIKVEDLAADESFQNWVNRANETDFSYWETWVKTHPQCQAQVQEAASIIRVMQSLRKKEVAHRKKDLIIRDLRHRLLKPETKVVRITSPRRWLIAAAVAAGIIIIFGTTLFFNVMSEPASTFSAEYGERKNVQLPDGSQVDLNANSGLTIKKTWEPGTAREVWLHGEAFFSIRHKPSNQRFIVHTDDGDIIVLGTQFNVLARRGKTQVVLTSGKVKVVTRNASDTIELEPGQMTEIVAGSGHEKKYVDTSKFTSWRRDTLSFEGMPLLDVASLIKDHYGYEVVWSDEKLKHVHFTYQLVGKDLDLLLATMSEALDLNIQKKEGLIYISSK